MNDIDELLKSLHTHAQALEKREYGKSAQVCKKAADLITSLIAENKALRNELWINVTHWKPLPEPPKEADHANS